MTGGVRTHLALIDLCAKELIERAFAAGPVFRMGYDAHVKAYRACLGASCFTRYHTDQAFAYAYDARLAFERGRPLPAWKDAA